MVTSAVQMAVSRDMIHAASEGTHLVKRTVDMLEV